MGTNRKYDKLKVQLDKHVGLVNLAKILICPHAWTFFSRIFFGTPDDNKIRRCRIRNFCLGVIEIKKYRFIWSNYLNDTLWKFLGHFKTIADFVVLEQFALFFKKFGRALYNQQLISFLNLNVNTYLLKAPERKREWDIKRNLKD